MSLGEIKIKCSSSNFLELDDLVIIQGNLKELSKINYEKLKGQILKHGFISPIHVWVSGGINKILDGSNRVRALTSMREEGYVIPPLPVTMIECESEKLAKEILLSLVSQFGELTDQGLYEYINEAGIDFAELNDYVLDYNGIDLDVFNKSFNEIYDIKLTSDTDNSTLKDQEENKKVCPSCGFTFF